MHIKNYITKSLNLLKRKDRAAFRLRRIIYSAFSTLGSRAVTMLVSIISLPLTINYLGAERFGMMETIVSLIMMMSFADLGLGFGLQNRIAELESNSDTNKLHKAISTVFYILLTVAICISVVFILFFPVVSWHRIFNVHSALAIQEAPTSIFVFFICFIIQIPFSIVRKIQGGFQEGHLNGLWTALGNFSGLLALLLVVYLQLGVPYIILAIYGANALFLILNFIYQFTKKRKHLFPKVSHFEISVFKELYKDGLIFFGLQIATIILSSSDRLIIAHLVGIEAVAIFSIGYRLAILFITPVDAFIFPLLPAFNDALAKEDYEWVKNILKKSFLLILTVSTCLGIVLFFGGNTILDLWIGDKVELSYSLLIVYGVFILYSNLNTLISYIMLTPHFINQFLKIFISAVFITILIKFYLVQYYEIQGIIWSTILGMSILFFLPALRILKSQKFI